MTLVEQLEKEASTLSEDNVEHKQFLDNMKFIDDSGQKIHRVVHINCGMGVYYELCKKNLPHIEYVGYAASKKAADLCRSHWDCDSFFYRKYSTLDKVLWMDTDLLILSVKKDPVEDINQVLGLDFANVIIPNIKITLENQDSIFEAIIKQGYEYHFQFLDIENELMLIRLVEFSFMKQDDDKSI